MTAGDLGTVYQETLINMQNGFQKEVKFFWIKVLRIYGKRIDYGKKTQETKMHKMSWSSTSWKHTQDSSKEITARGKIERSCVPHWEIDSLHHRHSWYKVYITCSGENLIFTTTIHIKWTKTLPIILFIFLFLNP